jgi:hypothetical protein
MLHNCCNLHDTNIAHITRGSSLLTEVLMFHRIGQGNNIGISV